MGLAENEGDGDIRASDDTILVLVKFKVRGNLRYLSHAEMLKLFQRACVRGGMEAQYSGGFNPRVKLRLPLPRSVGVESEDELLCLRVRSGRWTVGGAGGARFDGEGFRAALRGQLPHGCEVVSASLSEARASFEALGAMYFLPVRRECLNDELRERVERLLASGSMKVRRQTDSRGLRFKEVDVRGYLRSVAIEETGVAVECEISRSGSIRIEEIMSLLGLGWEHLAGPVKRIRVQWGGS